MSVTRLRALCRRTLTLTLAAAAFSTLTISPAFSQVPDVDELVGSEGSERSGKAAAEGEALIGIFGIEAGDCSGDEVTGSYFRMIQPGGSSDKGPFVDNGNSDCDDKSYTTMEPGDDGGLATSDYQPNPDPAFDNAGNAQSSGIFQPLNFQGIDYGGSTNPTDPQTKVDVDAPEIVHDGAGNLSGDVRSVSVAWNSQHFNQGAPKPDGSEPGITEGPNGTYDAVTGEYVLEWTSTIKGGPFDGFAGFWHLEGTFEGDAEPNTASGSTGGGSETDGGTGGSDPAEESGTTVGGTSGTGSSGSSGSAAAANDKELPFTGPLFPPFLGPVLFGAGAIGLIAARRKARR